MERLPVAGDDEEGVVDADAEADHRRQLRAEVRHREHVAAQGDERDAREQPEQGGADGQAHGQHGAEGDEQDDDGGQDAEQLRRRQLERAEHVAAVLDVQALHVDLVAEVTDLCGQRLVLGLVAIRHVELREGDGAVLADLPAVRCWVERAGDLDALQLVDLLEQAVHGLLHRGRAHAGRVLEDDLRRRAAAVRVGLLQHLEDRAGLRGGQLEVGPEVGADDAVGEDAQPDQDRDPDAEDEPTAAEAGAGESLQQHGGTSFVSDLQREDV